MFDSEYEKELKELGLTPKQIKEALAEAKTLKEESATLKGQMTTLTTELETTKGGYAEVRAKLDELEANSRRVAPKEPDKKTDFIDDGDRAFRERFVEDAAPIASMAFTAAKNVAKMSARISLQGQVLKTPNGNISLINLWDRWASDLDKAEQEMMKSNAAALQHERTWLNLFNYIKGQKLEELMAKPETFVESVSSSTNARVGDEKRPDKLNDE